jgi:cyclopropane-fatty-acyl-phospholipid synthase
MDDPHFFGKSYALTLAQWRERFEAALPQVRALGFDERFIRMWRYYLAYCRAGFSAGTIDVMQVRLNASR